MIRQLDTVKNNELLSKLDGNSVLIDVRESYEYEKGHIPQSINIPLGEIEHAAQRLDKNKVYYVICRSGRRSEIAVRTLMRHGFEKVYNVVPGMMRWK